MKTVTSTLLLAAITLATPVASAPKAPAAKLLDMYAVREGETFVIHILANGDISQFLSDRKTSESTYMLTLDVPALAPMESKYDLETPFSRRFQVWPMQLGKKIYSRIELELDVDASSVVGLQNQSHLFVRIQRESPMPAPSTAVASSAPPALEGERSPEAVPVDSPVADGGSADVPVPASTAPPVEASVRSSTTEPSDQTDEEMFFSLFPTPAQQQTLFNVAADDIMQSEEGIFGIRAGRFNLQPFVDFSWIRGENLLLASADGPFVDQAIMARGRIQATLLDSVHELKLAYEGRYRDFQSFTLEEKFTQVFDFHTKLQVSPSSTATIKNHFISGSFESQEFDPGGEVVASTDPFYRNVTQGNFGFELSERFGAEINASYNVVEFREATTEFFDYDSRSLGGTFLYNLSPLTSLLGEYARVTIPEPVARPEAGSYGDEFLFGVRGEITPMLRGQVRAGYLTQHYDQATVPQDFSGFVADAAVTRDFGEAAALNVLAGRRTTPSNFDENGFYVSNYGRLQFITPFARDFRLTASGALFFNDYPVADVDGIFRNDDILSAGVGVAYFITPLTYLSFDYRHDRRNSNLETYTYTNDALQFMVGFGFLNR
jgi:hypothetical protein